MFQCNIEIHMSRTKPIMKVVAFIAFILGCISPAIAEDVDARIDIWRSPNPSSILVVGGPNDSLVELLEVAFHTVDTRLTATKTTAFENYHLVIYDDPGDVAIIRSDIRAADSANPLVLRRDPSALETSIEAEALLAKWYGGIKEVEGLKKGTAQHGRYSSLVELVRPSRLLVVGAQGEGLTNALSDRGYKVHYVKTVEEVRKYSYSLVLVDTPLQQEQVKKVLGNRIYCGVLVRATNWVLAEYGALMLLARHEGNSGRARRLAAHRDGIGDSKVDWIQYRQTVVKESPKEEPQLKNEAHKADASDTRISQNLWFGAVHALMYAAVGFLLVIGFVYRFSLSKELAKRLDAWSVPYILAVGTFLPAVVMEPWLAVLGGAGAALGVHVRRTRS